MASGLVSNIDGKQYDRSALFLYNVMRWDVMSRDRSALFLYNVMGWDVMSRDKSACVCIM